mmetsp:Transcript_29022/g.88970  ORF Transcript_29022/g.88970 Transcript_29022/m.88970 type:complete len:261 (-) Transcript_29022:113-895(-)|eukprot:scaffold140857_cov31-Tisochrysis_lutea.AAC.1
MAAVPVDGNGWPPGLTRYDDVFTEAEQAELVAFAESMLCRGREGGLAGKSYVSVPSEWRQRGQGRETVHFGVLVKCNKVLNACVEPIPPPLVNVIARLVSLDILAKDQTPDTVCINFYEAGSWLPAHVDSAAFDRPFCTVSLLTRHVTLFGAAIASGDVLSEGPDAHNRLFIDLPVGSVLRVDGESAGPEWKHGLPPHPSRRISLTFRKLSGETLQAHRAIRQESELAQQHRRERKRAAKVAQGRHLLAVSAMADDSSAL